MTSIKKNIQSIFIIGSIVKLLGLFYKIVLTRILTLDGMTIYSLVFPALSLSICLSSFSIPIVCNQNISYNNAEKIYPIRSIVKASLRIVIITSSLVSLVILMSFPIYKYIYHNINLYYPLLVMIPLIFCSNFSGVLKSYLEANKEFKITQLSNLFEQLAKIFLSLGLLYIFRNYNLYVKVFIAFLAMSLSEVVSFSYLLVKINLHKRPHWKDTDSKKLETKLIIQAAPLTVEHFVVSLCAFFEPFIITLACKQAGISQADSERFFALATSYAIPLLIMASFTSQSILKAAFPFFCEHKNHPEKRNKYIDKALFSCIYAALFNFNVCFFYPDSFLYILFKDTTSSSIVKALAPFFLLYYFEPILRGLLQANNLEKNYLINTIISKTSTILLIVFLCQNPKIGLNGFIISIAVGTVLQNLLDYALISKKLKYSIKLKGIIYTVLIFAFNIILTLILKDTPKMFNFLVTNLLSLALLLFYSSYQANKRKALAHQLSHKKYYEA